MWRRFAAAAATSVHVLTPFRPLAAIGGSLIIHNVSLSHCGGPSVPDAELLRASSHLSVAVSDNVSGQSLTHRSPQWWIRIWPQVRRVFGIVNSHAHVLQWPRAAATLSRSAGLPPDPIVPVEAHWKNFATPALIGADYPDMVLLTPRTHCKNAQCGRPLSEPDLRHGLAHHHPLTIYSGKGVLVGNSYALRCSTCKLNYHSYYTAPFAMNDSQARSSTWTFDDHGLGHPNAIMVNTTTAVTWDYLADIDIRMLRSPFLGRPWRSNIAIGSSPVASGCDQIRLLSPSTRVGRCSFC